jgi:hypothetical protein
VEVKIDADELCELRGQITLLERSNKHKQKTIDNAIAEIRSLSNKLCEAHAKNVEYHVMCDWEKLSTERDWWRGQALHKTSVIDLLRSMDKPFSCVIGKLDTDLLKSVKNEALSLGYEVPE